MKKWWLAFGWVAQEERIMALVQSVYVTTLHVHIMITTQTIKSTIVHTRDILSDISNSCKWSNSKIDIYLKPPLGLGDKAQKQQT